MAVKDRIKLAKGTAVPPKADALLRQLRKDWSLATRDFARITGFSERAIAGWEAGAVIGPPARRRLLELRRLFVSLAELVEADALPGWFQSPNEALGGLKPIEAVERGEIDRLWRMIFFLESGVSN